MPEGATVALVGESGCGKSVTALSLARLVPEPPGFYAGGQVLFGGEDVLAMTARRLSGLRGRQLSYIFQEPGISLNPVFRVGHQIAEAVRLHRRDVKAGDETLRLMRRVGLGDPERRSRDYPHQLSGGMQQRVMIAMALACRPRLLVADEPTTALDVTIQAQILELLRSLQQQLGMAVLMITHNLGLVADCADIVNVMYAGRIVETGEAVPVLTSPAHPYTRALLDAVPRLEGDGAVEGNPRHGPQFRPTCRRAVSLPRVVPVSAIPVAKAIPPWRWWTTPSVARPRDTGPRACSRCRPRFTVALLELENVGVHFRTGAAPAGCVPWTGSASAWRKARVSGSSARAGAGRRRWPTPSSGWSRLRQDAFASTAVRWSTCRAGRSSCSGSGVQMIFQDPFESLNPRMSVGAMLSEVLHVHGLVSGREDCRARVGELLAAVGLDPQYAGRYPHEFSGGQRQRVGMARALAVGPSLVLADEPVSALDVSVQAQILNLLSGLREKMGLSYLFIAHDLAVVRHMWRKGAGDVPWPDRGVRHDQGGDGTPGTSLHGGPALRRAGCGSRPARAGRGSQPESCCGRTFPRLPRPSAGAPSTRAAIVPRKSAGTSRRPAGPCPTVITASVTWLPASDYRPPHVSESGAVRQRRCAHKYCSGVSRIAASRWPVSVDRMALTSALLVTCAFPDERLRGFHGRRSWGPVLRQYPKQSGAPVTRCSSAGETCVAAGRPRKSIITPLCRACWSIMSARISPCFRTRSSRLLSAACFGVRRNRSRGFRRCMKRSV